MTALFHNEDCTNFFYFNDTTGGKGGVVLDRYIDVIAAAGVTTLLCNTNAQLTNYQSAVWESFWEGFDPEGPDDQPVLAGISAGGEAVTRWRRMITHMLALHQQGIDYPARVCQRCRQRGVSPWISLRMNDVHNNDEADHPIHSGFWRDNPRLYRRGYAGYFARAFDFSHAEVRQYYMSLIEETLERYDIDGLELDFLREPYLFSKGEEAAGKEILTAWIGEIRQRLDPYTRQRGHAIRLGVRTPSRPEVALALGLDPVEWARQGLVDLVVAAPRWATLEYDMPMREWRSRLGSCQAILAGGLEVLIRSHRSAPPRLSTPEEALGAAAQVLHAGADSVYLFNYFQNSYPAGGETGETLDAYRQLLGAFSSLAEIDKHARRHAITFSDVNGPEGDERGQVQLPAEGKELRFRLPTGPAPDSRRQVELEIGLEGRQKAPAVKVNESEELTLVQDADEGECRLLTYRLPACILDEEEANRIGVVSRDGEALRVVSVGVRIFPPPPKIQ